MYNENALQQLKDEIHRLSNLDNPTPEELRTIEEFQAKVTDMEKLGEMTVEIARSFSFKLNVGNYESRDFFCSQKAECKMKDAEQISQGLYDFCKSQVVKDVNAYKVEINRERTEGGRKQEIKDIAKDEAQLDAGSIE